MGLWDHGAVMWGCGAVMFRGHGMGLWGHGALGAGWVSFGHIVSVKQSLEKRETEAAVECTPESCSPCCQGLSLSPCDAGGWWAAGPGVTGAPGMV